MEDASAAGSGRPRRKAAKLVLGLVEEGLRSDNYSGLGSEEEGKNAARKRGQYAKGPFSKRSKIPRKVSTTKATAGPYTTQTHESGSAPSASELNPSETSIAPSDSLPSLLSLAVPTEHSYDQHTYTDLDDLSDLTPLSSEVDTRPSTPDFVIEGLKARLYASQAESLASPRKKRKGERGKQTQVIPREDRRSASWKTEPNDSDFDSDMPPWYSISEPQKASPPKKASKTVPAPPKFTGISKGKRKRKSSMTSDDLHIDEDDDDHILLQIPGEGVLAKDSANKTEYWPARIDKYLPGFGKNKGKYYVTWLDNSTQVIPRSWFYTSQEEGFVTCALGKYESAFVEDPDDADEAESFVFERSASPQPLDPPPSPDQFGDLPIRHQFVYTKNVLKAILNGVYQPAKSQHEKFMKGGVHRLRLGHNSSLRGLMDPKQVERVQEHLIEWVLWDEKDTAKKTDSSREQEALEGGEPEDGDLVERPSTQPSLDDSSNVERNMQFASPPMAQTLFSLPPPGMPPSSCPTTGVQPEPSSVSELEPIASDADDRISPPPSSIAAFSALGTEVPSDEILRTPPLSLATLSVSQTEPTATVSSDDLSELTSIEDRQDAQDIVSQAVERPPRQTGCAAFESLPALEKGDYCTSVLLPEAVRQILLWRSGDRKSVDLLSAEEEQDLYEKGQELLEKTDWVLDIRRMRQWMEKARNKEFNDASKVIHRRNGSSSTRSRRNVPSVNYEE